MLRKNTIPTLLFWCSLLLVTACNTSNAELSPLTPEQNQQWLQLLKNQNLPQLKSQISQGKLPVNFLHKGQPSSYLALSLSYVADGKGTYNSSCSYGDSWQITQYLLEQGAILGQNNCSDCTNISHQLVNCPDALQLALELGDDPNQVHFPKNNPTGREEDHYALNKAMEIEPASKRYQSIKILLEHGANPNIASSFRFPLFREFDYIFYHSPKAAISKDEIDYSFKIIHLLAEHGADVNAIAFDREKPGQALNACTENNKQTLYDIVMTLKDNPNVSHSERLLNFLKQNGGKALAEICVNSTMDI